ncbi:Pentatricopeptide repeat-containing protein [Apostasia shenzhenica]|uniref:Pentatricopeptide repeat-containing protein n=1 Tax=Apostasia shenzhenica TaxID=1088818 RepID=A0A2I0AR36_9ASPA|nr:Pentatricopeptide repeat-containing protein [Apostasia shenzhenica]
MLERSPSSEAGFEIRSLSLFLGRCQSPRSLQQVHAQIITSPILGRRSVDSLLSRLLFFCAASPLPVPIPYLSSLFRSIPSPTLFDYNAIIRAQSSSPRPSLSALSLYKQMLAGGIRPDHLTFPFLLKFCSLYFDANAGKALHAQVVKFGLCIDVFVQNSVLYMYSSSGFVACAQKLFDEMPQRDVVSRNSLLVGYLRCGELTAAMSLFSSMEERNIRSWNSMITGLVQCGRAREALRLFQNMQLTRGGSVKPDKITIASVISACATLGALDQGKWLHSYLRRQNLGFDVVIGTSLIDMYGKCGCLDKAREVFDGMPEKDVMAWTAMISAFAVHGCGQEAFILLEEMINQGLKPNHVTFGSLLSACAHSGLVEKGRCCFNLMRNVYMIEPQAQHYACMVDLLGRAGLFSEAETLIRSMPMAPDCFVWGALLGACRMHGNVDLGERIADFLIGLDPLNHAFYIVLSDIYAKAKMYDNVKKIRNLMKERGIKKIMPGCSMIEVNGEVQEFSLKGTGEDLLKEIESVLNGISAVLQSTGQLIANLPIEAEA